MQTAFQPDALLDGDLAAVADRLRSSTVMVTASSGHGSGLVVDEAGTIVTNAHVASGRTVRITAPDGRESRSHPIARSPRRDLATMKSTLPGLVPVVFRPGATLQPGELVVAVGNPLDLVGAMTMGVVNRADRRGRRVVADVRLLPGNSGGPLADAQGRVVGINAMVVNGLAVAISWEAVRRFLANPHAQPFIGVTTRPLETSVLGSNRLGLLVLELQPHGPALRAGVLPGDVIIGMDGELFVWPSDFGDAVDQLDPGARTRLDVVRAGRVTGIEVIVGDAARADDRAA